MGGITIHRVRRNVKGGHGKYYVIAKKDGKVLTSKRYKGKVSLKSYKQELDEKKTFRKDAKRLSYNSNTYEYDKPYSRRQIDRKYGVAASTTINGELITARSRQDFWDNIDDAKREALENLYYRISNAVYGDYDSDNGEEYVNRNRTKITFRIFYYSR